MSMLRASQRAAWRHVPPSLAHWREDLAQDIAVAVWSLKASKGLQVPASAYRWAAWHAVRRLAFLLRYQVDGYEGWDEHEGDVPAELAPIALWRVQKCWDELSDLQRLALSQVVTGARTTVDLAGYATESALARARKTALARLDGHRPASGRTARMYQRATLNRVEDPVKRAARLQRAAAAARAKRAAKKAGAA
jgi:hypothetical protein